jgi:uncharacterized protein
MWGLDQGDRPRLISRKSKPRFWGILLIAPVLVLAAFLGTRLLQRAVPFIAGAEPATPQAAGLVGFADVAVTTADGQRLDAWWAPPLVKGHGVVLFLHGTPGMLDGTASRLADLREAGLGAMAIDYRGYGRSTGTPSERGLRLDARAAFDWLRRAAPESQIAVFGESLGTYPAIALAGERPVAGVLLNAPFASLQRLWQLHPPPPVGFMSSAPFDSAALIGRIQAPLLALQGSADEIVPLAEAERLFAAAPEPKTMIVVRGAGHVAAYRGKVRRRALATLVRWTGGSDARRR